MTSDLTLIEVVLVVLALVTVDKLLITPLVNAALRRRRRKVVDDDGVRLTQGEAMRLDIAERKVEALRELADDLDRKAGIMATTRAAWLIRDALRHPNLPPM